MVGNEKDRNWMEEDDKEATVKKKGRRKEEDGDREDERGRGEGRIVKEDIGRSRRRKH